jgi:hypothetical protein
MAQTDLTALFSGIKSQTFAKINKAVVATQVVGGYTSMWLSGTVPAAGVAPTAAAVCDNTLTGAIAIPARVGGEERILALSDMTFSIAGQSVIYEDRLAHMGGLNGTLTTAQTVGVDASVATSNLVARIGATDYSNVEWWLEWYTATGATAVNATVPVTFNDNTTTNIVVAVPASTAASRRLPILSATAGKWIKSVQSVTLSASTLTAGNFGVTATRKHAQSKPCDAINKLIKDNWYELGSPVIPDSACVAMSMLTNNASTGTLIGDLKYSVK